MFVRDALTATMLLQQNRTSSLGDAADDVASDADGMYSQDPQLARLHQLVLLIVALRSNFDQQVASGDADPAVLTQYAGMIQNYVAQFKAMRATIDRGTVDQNALSVVDQAMLDIGNWSQQALAALPNALAAIPNALLDALANIFKNAGKDLASALVWPAIIGGGLLLFVMQAEKSRTYRKVVA